MKFFIDTANLDDIKKYYDWGIVDGVTTNPSLVAKEGVSLKDRTIEICKVVDGPVSAEVVATDHKGMMKEALEYSQWHKNVVIKLPLIPEGLKTCKVLTQQGIKTNVTLCFSASQALLAAKAGATYVSPFIGRLDDISQDGMELIAEIREIYDNYDYQTQILVASIRHPRHVVDAARIGGDVATIPPKVLDQLVKHPLTDSGLEKFLADWETVKDKQ
jgi:transaldolase